MIKRAVHLFINNHKLIEKLRSSYDPLSNLIASHVTLVFPFESNIDSKDLEAHILEASRNIEPFQLQLSELVTTSDNCLILKVKEGHAQCVQLHEQLYTGLLFPFLLREYPYSPHVTVGRFLQKLECKKVLESLKPFNHVFSSRIESLTTEIILEDGRSEVEFIVPLSIVIK